MEIEYIICNFTEFEKYILELKKETELLIPVILGVTDMY